MHLKTFALIIGLAGSAEAAGVSYKLPAALGNIAPIYMPGVSIIPMSLPTVNGVIAVPTRAPSVIVSVIPAPAPLILPVLPAAAIGRAVLPAPSIDVPFALNWSLLDDKGGDEAAPALVSANPGPKPLAPAGALNELRDLSEGRDPIRSPGSLFEGRRREKLRDLEIPASKYF